MVRYLKYIVVIFGGIGILAASFFVLQNKKDLMQAYEYSEKFEYAYLQRACALEAGSSVFPCLRIEYQNYLNGVSLTGTSIGLKMIFNLLEEDREKLTKVKDENAKSFTYSLYHLEINNMALSNAYKNYFGFSFLYGGFVSSLKQYYLKAHRFSQDIITGLEGPKGISILPANEYKTHLESEFSRIKKDYYRIKKEANIYINKEWDRLSRESQKQ